MTTRRRCRGCRRLFDPSDLRQRYCTTFCKRKQRDQRLYARKAREGQCLHCPRPAKEGRACRYHAERNRRRQQILHAKPLEREALVQEYIEMGKRFRLENNEAREGREGVTHGRA